MTRKDYQLIARTIYEAKAEGKSIDELAQAMAEELHRASGYTPNGNKSFNDDKFLTACGLLKD